MILKKYRYSALILSAIGTILLISGCERELVEPRQATLPSTQEIFLDGFSAGLNYAAFGGSNVSAFNVDEEEKYKGTASMRFDVPDPDDNRGAYAAGVFKTEGGRDLTSYTALTFWAKATESVSIDEIGFGFTFEEEQYATSIADLAVSTGWRKYIIPMADPGKLSAERGLFYYIDTPDDGEGYSFWVDEVQFEDLGTIAYARPSILDGHDEVIEVETGEKITIDRLSSTFNLPDGADQRVELGHGYFTFSSSATSVAMVDDLGQVSVIDSGSTVITATIGSNQAAGSLTVRSSGAPLQPLEPAPAPTIGADSVIALFSDVYENVPVDTWDTGWEFSNADVNDIQISGDNVKRYKNLNFVGIEFSSETVDATSMTHFHMDIWTPDPTELPRAFRVLLVDFGANGAFDGGDDSSHELAITSPQLTTESWVSLDIPLTSFTGLRERAHLAQMVLSGDLPNVYVDNVYFYVSAGDGGPTEPAESAPEPDQDAMNVISIFSDSYTNLEETNLNPDWGQATVVSEVSIEGNNTLLYAGLNYQGIELAMSQDVSDMDFLHLDFWTSNSTLLNAFLISPGPVETAYSLPVPTSGWVSVDIPLTDFSPVNLGDLIQFKFDGNGDIYLDNIYFYKEEGGISSTPEAPAPNPSQDATNVISVFSDAYANLEGTNLNPNWGQATVVSEVDIQGNNTLLYSGLNFQGIELGMSEDVSSMEFLHIDVWSANASTLNAFLISSGPVENAYAIQVPTSGWSGIDIPLTEFSDVNLSDLIQFKFEGEGDVYLDNIFFYTEGGGMTSEPIEAAPAPTQDASNVISIFSDAYMDLEGSNLNPNWGQATVVSEVSIAGNNTLLYSGLNFQGIELAMSQDMSAMEFLHIDFWTSNSSALNAFLISTGPAENAYALTVPTSGWSSVDIPLTEFPNVNLADLIQFKFEGDGDVYLDNIYFYTEGGGMSAEPVEAAPTPTADSADVISIFSDAYNNLAGTDLNPNWGQGTQVSEVSIEGNNTLLYTGLNFQGIQLASSLDVTGMSHIHIDFWSASSTALNLFLISSGPVEMLKALTVPTSGWVSVDIPLTDFTAVNLADLVQFKFDGNGDIYIDNIYFWK